MFIFDYDDKLFPTTLFGFLEERNKRITPFRVPDQAAALAELEEATIRLLEKCLRYGKVKIVSNGSMEWLAWSFSAYMRPLRTFLQNNHIPVISAYDEVGWCAPRDPMKWKRTIFEREFVDTFLNFSEARLISIGDGRPELVAMDSLMTRYPEANLNSFRFAKKLM